MTYTDPYPSGWVDLPAQTTPITAASLNGMRQALKDLYTPTPVVNGSLVWDGSKFTAAALLKDAQIDPAAAIGASKLAGYPTDGTKVLKGDGTWGTIASGIPILPAGGSVASASTMVVPSQGYYWVTGTTRIDTIPVLPIGTVIVLQANAQASGIPVVLGHLTGNLVLQYSRNCGLYQTLPAFGAVFESITLLSYDGSHWMEIGRDVVETLDYVQITANVTLGAGDLSIIGSNTITYDGATPMTIEFFSPRVDYSSAAFHSLYDGPALSIVGTQSLSSSNGSHPFMSRHRLTPSATAHVYTWVARGTGDFIYAGTGAAGAQAPAYLKISRAV